mmetsp:Transcript_4983/g.4575  ORF Transcript_4983/g.4575 Transcript_4983/m.4575 type:complete len:82 (-) Transcript_4983:2-247(-)
MKKLFLIQDEILLYERVCILLQLLVLQLDELSESSIFRLFVLLEEEQQCDELQAALVDYVYSFPLFQGVEEDLSHLHFYSI